MTTSDVLAFDRYLYHRWILRSLHIETPQPSGWVYESYWILAQSQGGARKAFHGPEARFLAVEWLRQLGTPENIENHHPDTMGEELRLP